MTENTDQQNKNTEWQNRELGALWKKHGKNQTYLSGFVKVGDFGVEREVRLVIFTNKNKSKNERAPDFVIYESKDANSTPEQSTPEQSTQAEKSSDDEVPELLS